MPPAGLEPATQSLGNSRSILWATGACEVIVPKIDISRKKLAIG